MNKLDPIDVLARTVWAEARGDGRAGMSAVAAVIMNRVTHPRWWGHDVISVCLDPWQFSCWNTGDPNLPKLEAVTTDDPDFAIALDIATRAVAGQLPDPTGGADSYFDVSIKAPVWAETAVFTVRIGSQRFYRTTLPPPSKP